MDGATANARRKYHHVHHGGKLTEHDIAGMVRGMEDKDAEIARLTAERDQARAQIAAVIEQAAQRAQAPFLPCPIGGDLMCDNLQGECTANAIRKLAPDDAAAALNQMLNEAYKAGQRDMLCEAKQASVIWHQVTHIRAAIRALPIKERNE